MADDEQALPEPTSASLTLDEAMALLDGAEEALEEIRLGTPVDYMSTDGGPELVTERFRRIDAENFDPAIRTAGMLPEDERDRIYNRFGPLFRSFEYLAGEANEGRLPMLKEAAWPLHEWVQEDNMRADAEEAAAEPATNGYGEKEVPDAEDTDGDSG